MHGSMKVRHLEEFLGGSKNRQPPETCMRSFNLLFLCIPIPIIILIALFGH
jgi:hypothetical protein